MLLSRAWHLLLASPDPMPSHETPRALAPTSVNRVLGVRFPQPKLGNRLKPRGCPPTDEAGIRRRARSMRCAGVEVWPGDTGRQRAPHTGKLVGTGCRWPPSAQACSGSLSGTVEAQGCGADAFHTVELLACTDAFKVAKVANVARSYRSSQPRIHAPQRHSQRSGPARPQEEAHDPWSCGDG